MAKTEENAMQKVMRFFNAAGIREVGACPFSAVEDRLLSCAAKRRLPPAAKTVLVCLFPYKVKQQPPKEYSRYAAVMDYHPLCLERLQTVCAALREQFCQHVFEPFVDNSPIPEVYAAVKSGLGVLGRNRLLLHSKYGSYVFIGEIVTDLDLNAENRPLKTCYDCGACLGACPTQSLCSRENACLSAVTQQKQPLNAAQEECMRENHTIWGCDVCQAVCPYNRAAEQTDIKAFISSYQPEYEPGQDITNRPFAWRKEAVIQRNYEVLHKLKG